MAPVRADSAPAQAPVPVLAARELGAEGFGPLSIDVATGRVTGLRGPSGSGKSRLLRLLADLDPHDGTLRLAGEGATSMPAHRWRRRVALVPAESRWWLPSAGAHMAAAAAAPYLDALDLEQALLEREVERLSSGERQRLALVRALARAPEVLLLDEPTANLDGRRASALEAVVGAYAATRPAGVLWVSHDEEQLERVATAQWRMLPGGRLELLA